MSKTILQNREEWLRKATDLLRPLFKSAEHPLPEHVQVSCGWPSKQALSRKRRRIGECWDVTCAADKMHHIFISPCLSDVLDPYGVLPTLVHELGHAAVGIPAGHKAPFKRMMKAMGLEGKATSTHAGEELLERLRGISGKLGDYPHGQLELKSSGAKKQGTRLHKCECPGCGYTVRVTQKWIDVGLPICPECEKPMEAA